MNSRENQKKECIIDGSLGEGGGQILRTALSLSVITGIPFKMHSIRAGRPKPGLLRQHLACVRAAGDISGAHIEGAEQGSQELTFVPGTVRAGNYSWEIGSAGSTSLVLQTVLLPLLHTEGRSMTRITGGTHNGMAPPFGFLDSSFRPLMEKLGYSFSLNLERPGFYPAGGGAIRAETSGCPERTAQAFNLDSREITGMDLTILYSGIRNRLVHAAAGLIGDELEIPDSGRHVVIANSPGPGWAAWVSIWLRDGKTVCTAFGERRSGPEEIAAECVRQARRYLDSGGRVDEYLQDQLLLPLALSGGGRFTTCEPSQHTVTNMEVIGKFLPLVSSAQKIREGLWEITMKGEMI